MPFQLLLPAAVHDALLAQARAEQPNECCGLLAGVLERPNGADVPVGRVLRRYPLTNALASPVRYHADEKALLAAHRDMREQGLDLLAIYHSHPTSTPVPSRTDHERWFYGPEVVCLIVSLTTSPPTVRGWWMAEMDHREAVWAIG